MRVGAFQIERLIGQRLNQRHLLSQNERFQRRLRTGIKRGHLVLVKC